MAAAHQPDRDQGQLHVCRIHGPTGRDRYSPRSIPLTSISVQHDRAVIPSPRQWLHRAYAHAGELRRWQDTPHHAKKPWDQPVHTGVVAIEGLEVFLPFDVRD